MNRIDYYLSEPHVDSHHNEKCLEVSNFRKSIRLLFE